MQPRLDFDDFDRRAAIVGNERFGPRHHQQIERIVIRPALPRRELGRLGSSPPPQRIEAQQPARSRIRISAIFRSPIQQPRDDPMLTDPQPGSAGFKILPANNMRILEQGSRVSRRPLEKLITISRNDNWTIPGSLKINRQRAHRFKIDSPQPPPQALLILRCRDYPCPRKRETHGGFHIRFVCHSARVPQQNYFDRIDA